MKQKTKFDFLAINRRMNGNWNGGNNLLGSTKKITNGKEFIKNKVKIGIYFNKVIRGQTC